MLTKITVSVLLEASAILVATTHAVAGRLPYARPTAVLTVTHFNTGAGLTH